jgi:hypothetical protein
VVQETCCKIRRVQVAVFIKSRREEQLRVAEFTHPNNIGLIIADTRVVFAQVFCDMGTGFVMKDTTVENALSALVAKWLITAPSFSWPWL